ncbi:MAG: carbon-nitrogen hydrolase [bacterium]|nr:carbon-nitrogen hydrolase [bacterium]
MRDRVRVAAVQFATGTDLDENLAVCLRMLDAAAAEGAEVVVMPEFCNHLSVYEDRDHCRSVAVSLDGPWLGALAQRSAGYGIYTSLTVTVSRGGDRVTATNVLINPRGRVVATADKQMLMGNERACLSAGGEVSPVADTAFGPVGLYSCMDGVTFEVPRTFAVRGARLLLNSLNSFALDEARLHIPARAVENGVYVVAANKVGPLLPAEQVPAFSQALGVPPEALNGAGESQVVAPDGTVMAMGPRTGEAVVVADLDLSLVEPDRLRRRRPEVYRPLAQSHTARPAVGRDTEVIAGCVPGARRNPALVEEAVAAGAFLVVLPELTSPPTNISPGVLVVTTARRDGRHFGQVWSAEGLVHEQAQIHYCDRFPDATRLGTEVSLYPAPFGDLAVVVGDDHRYPEFFRLAAVAGAHLVVVCWQPEHRWECDLALVERAAENRISVAACGLPGPLAATMLLNPPADSLWNPHRSTPYTGTINTPASQRVQPDDELLVGTLHPGRALNREVSKDTDLVGGRPWQASAVLTEGTSAGGRVYD